MSGAALDPLDEDAADDVLTELAIRGGTELEEDAVESVTSSSSQPRSASGKMAVESWAGTSPSQSSSSPEAMLVVAFTIVEGIGAEMFGTAEDALNPVDCGGVVSSSSSSSSSSSHQGYWSAGI